jgi:hypothetical protein
MTIAGRRTWSGRGRIRFSVGCRMRLDLPIIIQTILLDPSGAIWTDGASNVSRLDLSGAVWFEPSIRLVAEARSARRSVRGGPKPVGAPSRVTAESDRTSPSSRPPNVVPFLLRPVWCCPFTVSGRGWLLRRGLRGGPCGRAPGLVGTRGPASSQPGGLPGSSIWGDTLRSPERPAAYGARVSFLAPARAALGSRVGCQPRRGPGPR